MAVSTRTKLLGGILTATALLASVLLAMERSTEHAIEHATFETVAARRLLPQLHFEGAHQQRNPVFAVFLTITKVVICIYLAFCILIFGGGLSKALIVVQSLTGAGIWAWWTQVSNTAYVDEIPVAIEDLVKVLFTGGATGYLMMAQEIIDIVLKGILLASIFIDQVLDLLMAAFMNWAGCKEDLYLPALSTRGQKYDMWQGCTKEHEYYTSIFVFKLVEWTVIILGGVLSKKIEKQLKALSAAMLGADLCAASLIQAVQDIMILVSSQEDVDKAKVTLMTYKLVICYVLFVVGFFIQLAMIHWVEAGCKHEQREMVNKYFRFLTALNKPALPFIKWDHWLQNGFKGLSEHAPEADATEEGEEEEDGDAEGQEPYLAAMRSASVMFTDKLDGDGTAIVRV